MKIPKKKAELFWLRVKIGNADECWPWLGYCAKTGYGMLSIRSYHPHPQLAHRIAWTLAIRKIPKGKHILHKCDNPPCCNPKHLFLGTQRDNNIDRDKKGRVASGNRNGAQTQPEKNPFIRNRGSGLYGEKHPQAKLTNGQVAELRNKYKNGRTKASLAREYSLSQTHVGRLVEYKSRKRG